MLLSVKMEYIRMDWSLDIGTP